MKLGTTIYTIIYIFDAVFGFSESGKYFIIFTAELKTLALTEINGKLLKTG